MKLHPDLAAKCLQLADRVDGEPVKPIAVTVSEKQLQAEIIKLAKRLGWMVYHTYDSRKSQRGFPDLVLVRGERVIFAELKTQDGRLQADQSNWRDALEHVGGNVSYYLWRPSDWERIMEVLA